MKRILFPLLFSLVVGSVSAQSLNDLFRKLTGGNASSEQTEPATVVVHPSTQELSGTWHYQKPSIEYKGEDMLASIAVTGLKDRLAGYYIQAGLVPGQGTVSFLKRGQCRFVLGEHEIEGRYTYDPKQGTADITLTHETTRIALRGYLTLSNDLLTLQFDADEALQAVQRTVPRLAEDEKIRQISAILQNYPGILVGGILKK